MSCLLALMLVACGRIGYQQVQLGASPADAQAVDGPLLDAGIDASIDGPVDTRFADVLPSEVSVTDLQGRPTGNRYLDWCPGDELLMGIEGAAQAATGSVYTDLVGQCGPPRLSAAPPYRVTSIPYRTSLPSRGSGQVEFSQSCGEGQAIVGLEGRADPDLRALSIVCADLVVIGGPASFQLVPGSDRTVIPLMNAAGGTAFSAACRPGHVARGAHLYVGPGIQAIGLVCSTFSISP